MICYTIGHATRNFTDFINIIKSMNIDCVMDIRSNNSNLRPEQCQYLKHNLKQKLNMEGINWIDINNIFVNTNYKNEIYNHPKYNKGVNMIIEGIRRKHRIAILSIEKNPALCPRGVLLGYSLKKNGVEVKHIIDDTKIVNQNYIDNKLYEQYKNRLSKNINLKSIIIEESYRLKSKEIIKRL